MLTLSGIRQDQTVGSNDSPRGSLARADILRNTDVAECLNAWPSRKMPEGGLRDPGQARALTGCSVPPAICHGGSSGAPAGWVCGPGGQGHVMGGGVHCAP